MVTLMSMLIYSQTRITNSYKMLGIFSGGISLMFTVMKSINLSRKLKNNNVDLLNESHEIPVTYVYQAKYPPSTVSVVPVT